MFSVFRIKRRGEFEEEFEEEIEEESRREG